MEQRLKGFAKRVRAYLSCIPLETVLRYAEAVQRLGGVLIAGSLAGLFLTHVSGFSITPARSMMMLLTGWLIAIHGFYVDSETEKKMKQGEK